MKTLLRSTFAVNAVSDHQDSLTENFRMLEASGITFEDPVDHSIWTFIRDFVQQHKHPPELSTLRAHFERSNLTANVDRIEEIAISKPKLNRGDFEHYLNNKAEDRRKQLIIQYLQEAGEILQKGVEIKNGKGKEATKLFGPSDAMSFLMDKAHDILTPVTGIKIAGEVTSDVSEFLAEYERVKNDPRAGLGQMVGLGQMDECIAGAKRHELWVHAGYTSHAKCVAGDTRIWDPVSGIYQTVKQAYESGIAPMIHALNETTTKIVPSQVGVVALNGEKQIYKIQSEKGRSIRVSDNHPFLTPTGWVDAGDLVVGGWIATPANLHNNITQSPWTDNEVMLLGYLIGDGSTGPDTLGFTAANPAIQHHFEDILSSMGYSKNPPVMCGSRKRKIDTSGLGYTVQDKVHTKTQVHTLHYSISKCDGTVYNKPWVSPIRNLLNRVGLWGCSSYTKFVPAELWQATDTQLWSFISALWSTDGYVGTEKCRSKKNGRAYAGYGSVSKTLCTDIQSILQRLGVSSTVRVRNTKYNGKPYQSWALLVTTAEGLTRFFDNTKIIGKEPQADVAKTHINEHNTNWVPVEFMKFLPANARVRGKSGYWIYARHLCKRKSVQHDTFMRFVAEYGQSNPALQRLVDGDIRWEKIESIEPDGVEMTYDLSVPEHSNFVANGFITHNSLFELNWAYNQAVYYRNSVLIFSLEMPYHQCRRLIYLLHSGHEKFRGMPVLDYQRVRDGQCTAAEEAQLKVVAEDFGASEYGQIHIEVRDPNKSTFTIADVKHRAETIYARTPFQLLFIDHALLLDARKWVPSLTDRMNEVLRESKQLAMTFNRGLGMAVVCLFQINRDGFKQAMKRRGGEAGKDGAKPLNNHVYDLTALAQTSEAERSADIVTATWLDDDLRSANQILYQCLKNRDGKLFEPFLAGVHWPTRRLFTLCDPNIQQVHRAGQEIDISQVG